MEGDPNSQLASKRHQLNSLWNSWSWRISRPVRNLIGQTNGHYQKHEPNVESVEEANRAIAAIHQSLSWRMTAPLRVVHSRLFGPPADSIGKATPQQKVLPQQDTISWDKLAPLIEEQAARFSVSSEIHRADFIFRFIMGHKKFVSDEAAAVRYYFEDGAKSARQSMDLMRKHCRGLSRKPKVLEFASGYGLVTRHLTADRSIDLESCDIHTAAIDFLQNKLGGRAIQSSRYPETASFPHAYDFVFVLSFFSHMPIVTWTRWLVRLIQSLKPGGVLAFTTHGMASRPQHGDPEIGPLGFWFLASSEQTDLSTDEYGSAIVTEAFVRKAVQSIPSVELIETRLAYWWGHQDLYVLRKTG